MRPAHWPPWLLVHSTPSPLYSACQILGMLSKRYGLGKQPGPGLERASPAGLALAYAKYCCPVGCRAHLTSSHEIPASKRQQKVTKYVYLWPTTSGLSGKERCNDHLLM